jgi:DNA-binding transcriptional ArsR family regulator
MDDRCDLLCLDLERAEELRANQLGNEVARLIASRMQALADPTRLGLIDALEKGGELCVCDLAWITGKAQNLVSHHLKVLKAEGLADSRREGKIVFYSLTQAGAFLYAQATVGAIRDLVTVSNEDR